MTFIWQTNDNRKHPSKTSQIDPDLILNLISITCIQDLEKARIWLHKAKDSYKYLALCAPKLSVSEYLELAPEVNKANFADLSEEQLGILRTAQTLTMSLDNERIFKECVAIIDKYLILLIDMEKEVF